MLAFLEFDGNGERISKEGRRDGVTRRCGESSADLPIRKIGERIEQRPILPNKKLGTF
jgi:hypothetical protein